jgi:hypothetical protein
MNAACTTPRGDARVENNPPHSPIVITTIKRVAGSMLDTGASGDYAPGA